MPAPAPAASDNNSDAPASQLHYPPLQRLRRLAGHLLAPVSPAAPPPALHAPARAPTTTVSASPAAAAGAVPLLGIADSPDGIACLDYGRSYARPYSTGTDAVRVLVEGRTIIYDDAAPPGTPGAATVYYLLASCKSEDTYGLRKQYGQDGFKQGARTLFSDPNYDFSWIIGGGGQSLIFRRGVWADLEVSLMVHYSNWTVSLVN